MKDMLSEFWQCRGKKLLLQIIISGAAIILAGIMLGHKEVIIGVIEGYFLAGIYIYIMIFRISRLTPAAVRRGKMEMWMGLILRLIALLLIAKVAFAQTVILGYIILAVFGWGFILFMGNLIIYNYKDIR